MKTSKLERFSAVCLYAGFLSFIVAFLMLGLFPAYLTQKTKPDDKLADSVPAEFQKYYPTLADYRQGLIRGRDHYISEACWHCHSQYVRPVSNEALRYGPVGTPGEYDNILQMPQLFGTRRVGPDLSRESGKRTNDWHFAHLFSPRSVEPQSVMPSYSWYFETVKGEVKPTQRGVDLVAFLQWLGKDMASPTWNLASEDAITLPPH